MEIKRTIRHLGIYRGVFKLVYQDGYYWRWIDSEKKDAPELIINEGRDILHEWQSKELLHFKPKDLALPEAE